MLTTWIEHRMSPYNEPFRHGAIGEVLQCTFYDRQGDQLLMVFAIGYWGQDDIFLPRYGRI